jgi:N-carbamoyl-L-amino-acid hydrolase
MSGPGGNLAIDGERLWASIMETARIGATPKGGICRLTLTDLDRQVRDWFRAACIDAGCSVTIDAMGNMFARRPGRDPALKPIAIGSHLDTQPTGGKYDGIIGVLAGLEVLRTLNDRGYETNAPIEVINWTNEEGSRFAPAMLSSGVFAGAFDTDYAYARQDREGKRFGDELERIGYKGDTPCGGHALGAHFELHIEQGPILEAEARTIGVVTGVQGMRWYEVNVTGAESHAGSTPMRLRRDALQGAARMIGAVNQLGWSYAPDAVATVGLIESRPNSRNVVPGSVFFTIDLRHPNDQILAQMETDAEQALRNIATATELELAIECVWDSPAVRFDAACVDAVRRAAEAAGYPSRDIVSGAGHDSAYVARVAPTTMIFVPCE